MTLFLVGTAAFMIGAVVAASFFVLGLFAENLYPTKRPLRGEPWVPAAVGLFALLYNVFLAVWAAAVL